MQTMTLIVGGILLASAGCESAQDRCNAAKEGAHAAWGPVVDGALEASRTARAGREQAIAAVTTEAMDLGNLRSTQAEERFGTRNDAFVGIEVSIGAIIGAMLAADELWAVDSQAAEAVVAKVNEELDGRYGELMTAALDDDGVEARMIELGDGCSTTLQLLVREQPERVRARVLGTFQELESREGEPAEGVDLARVKASWLTYVNSARAGLGAQAALDAAVEAREAASGSAAAAKEKADAVPDGLDGLATARQASQASFDACSSL